MDPQPGSLGTAGQINYSSTKAAMSVMPVGRLVEPAEVASLIGELYRNEAIAGETFFIHGGLRLGSRG